MVTVVATVAVQEFQFTRARGARQHFHVPRHPRHVSIHARTGRATGSLRFFDHKAGVSIHARTGRATSPCSSVSVAKKFQFTRARGARRFLLRKVARREHVSIHARTGRATPLPYFAGASFTFQFTRARGARPGGGRGEGAEWLFQFTRARGARRAEPRQADGVRSFNSRAHGARDTSPAIASRPSLSVSIHARTGRATGWRASTACPGRCFNSRAHGARDHRPDGGGGWGEVSIHARTGRATSRSMPTASSGWFQFTRARGARRCCRRWSRRRLGFNSRAHGARDEGGAPFGRVTSVSIHARTGRATASSLAASPSRTVSIHARTGRATPRHIEKPSTDGVSIHARTGRATSPAASIESWAKFQFTRARGARLGSEVTDGRAQCFNSRAHGARDIIQSPGISWRNGFQFTRARGARPQALAQAGLDDKFQFTRARGARPRVLVQRPVRHRFNSRAHGARDRQ